MYFKPYLLSAAISAALMTPSYAVYASDCAAQLDNNFNLAIPCLVVGAETYSTALNFTPMHNTWSWSWPGSLGGSACRASADSCTTLDAQLGLNLPLYLAGVKFLMELSYAPGTNNYSWQFAALNPFKSFNRIASFPICSQIDATCNTDTETAAEIVAASQDGMTLIYSDSPMKQIGFVDIADTPYTEIVDAARRVGNNLYRIRFEEKSD